MAYEDEYATWIEKIAEYLRKKHNRDYKTLPYAYELRFFSGYSPKDVIRELHTKFQDINVKRISTNVVDRAIGY
jgi:hypothetical protein